MGWLPKIDNDVRYVVSIKVLPQVGKVRIDRTQYLDAIGQCTEVFIFTRTREITSSLMQEHK
jgi:hypothetical protein